MSMERMNDHFRRGCCALSGELELLKMYSQL